MSRGVAGYLSAIVFIAIGGGIIALAVWLGVQVEQRKTWPTIDAVVTSSGWTGSETDPQFNVVFKYQVEGEDYQGSVDIDPYESPYDGPEAYPPGARVPAHYNPKDPNDSVLHPGNHWMNAYAIAFGTIIVLFGMLPFVQLALRLYAKRQLAVAKSHLRKFADNMEQANAGLEAVRDKYGSEYQAGAKRKAELLAEAEDVVEMYRELEEELDDWDDETEEA